jgi:hypothetical protein
VQAKQDRSVPLAEQIASVATNTRKAIIAGFCLIAATIGGFGIWSTTVPISSAIVANGQVVVASKRSSSAPERAFARSMWKTARKSKQVQVAAA